MLGFPLDIWDYPTFATFALVRDWFADADVAVNAGALEMRNQLKLPISLRRSRE